MNELQKIMRVNLLILGIVIISGCGNIEKKVEVEDSQKMQLVENNKFCEINSDCVPASCCHSIDVVNKENAPNCENLKCTASCETILDCGQGRPVCNDGQCEIERNIEDNLGIEEIEEIKSVDLNHYKSENYNLDFKYPSDWYIKESKEKILISSDPSFDNKNEAIGENSPIEVIISSTSIIPYIIQGYGSEPEIIIVKNNNIEKISYEALGEIFTVISINDNDRFIEIWNHQKKNNSQNINEVYEIILSTLNY